MTVQYMTPDGDFAASCQTEADRPHPALIEAPPGGAYGMHWDGTVWAYDPGADARAHAMMYPALALAEERAEMACTPLQAMLALGEARWAMVEAALAARPWEVRARFKAAETWRRTNPVVIEMGAQALGLTDSDLDNLFRLAMGL